MMFTLQCTNGYWSLPSYQAVKRGKSECQGKKKESNESKQQSRGDGVGVGRVNVILNKLTFDFSLSRGHICPFSSGPLINSPAGSPYVDTQPLSLLCYSPQISAEELFTKTKPVLLGKLNTKNPHRKVLSTIRHPLKMQRSQKHAL